MTMTTAIRIPFIDGPNKGHTLEIASHRKMWACPVPRLKINSAILKPNSNTLIYYRHDLVTGVYKYPVMSIHENPSGINLLFAYKMLLEFRIDPLCKF